MRATAMMMAVSAALVAAPAPANPRETLAAAAFTATSKDAALAQVDAAQTEAEAILARSPQDRDAAVYRAMAIGYRAKLTKSPASAKQARALFEALAAANPNDPQALALVGGWHLDAIDSGVLARTVLGAKREVGVANIDRAAALGKDAATYPAVAAMMHIRLDPADVAIARGFAEAAAHAPTPTAVDRIMQRDATTLLAPLRAGDGKSAAALARAMLPFGRIR